MILDELRQECNAVVKESNDRWKSIPQKLKEAKIPSPPVKQGYPVSVYDESGELVAEFQSIKDTAKYSGITHRMVVKSCDLHVFIDTKYGRLRFDR